MGATFSRLKNWIAEVLNYADLNAEIDNILNNLDPSGVDDYSVNVAQMRLTTDPGESGSESLATSLAGEIQRLRFAIKEIKGSSVSYWYQSAATSLSELNSVFGNNIPRNRISSGKMSANSSQLISLIPAGTAASLIVDGSPTNFIYYIDGTQYTISTDLVTTGMGTAPSTNNTCLVNDSQAGGQQYTQYFGEYGTSITVDNMGTEITSLVGKFAGFSITNGSAQTEYFTAFVNSATELTKAWRGVFFNSSGSPVKKVTFSDNDTITLLRLTYVFANTSGTLAITYTVPHVGGTAPTSPSNGDYWFDVGNDTWKIFNSTTWVSASATLVGMSVQTSANCVGARTFDQLLAFTNLQNMGVERLSNTVVRASGNFSQASVGATNVQYGFKPLTWDITANLDSGVTEAASTYYYLYIKENGDPLISDLAPTELRGPRKALYHPSEMWRWLAVIRNDGSSNFEAGTLYGFTQAESNVTQYNCATGTSLHKLAIVNSGSDLSVKLVDRIGNYPSNLVPTFVTIADTGASSIGQTAFPIRSNLALTVPSGATLGHGTATNQYVFVYAMNNGGTPQLAVSGIPFSDSRVQTATAIDTSADLGNTLYSGSAASNKVISFLGIAQWNTAINGTWTTPDYVSTLPHNYFANDKVATSAAGFTPASASNIFHTLSNNSILLGPGDWEIFFQVQWNTNTNTLQFPIFGVYGANGANSSSTPAAASSLTGVSIIDGFEGTAAAPKTSPYSGGDASFTHFYGESRVTVRLTTAQRLYGVAASGGSGTDYRIAFTLMAKRIRDLAL